jgi:hypothetical protein
MFNSKSPLLILIAGFFTCFNVCAQQVIYAESFEGNNLLPPGWGQASASINRWSRQNASTFPTVNLGSSGIEFARFQARGANPNTAQTIALPVLDYRQRGTHKPMVSFYMYRDSLSKAADSLSVYVNTTLSLNGATHLGTIARYSRKNQPDTQITNGWYKYKFFVPAGFNGAKNYIMFKGFAVGGNASNNIYLDSFWWDAWPQVCTGKPSGSLIASTPDIICGGSGTAALNLSGAQADYSGITIQWQMGTTSAGPWTNFGTGGTTATTGTITISRFYRCILTCSASSLADTTNVYVMKVISTPKPTITISPSPATYCAGSTPLLLIASGAKSYVWNPTTNLNVSNNDSVLASPPNSTAYSVTGTDSLGCTGTANVNVTVRQSPVVNITAADSNVCIGDSVRLTAAGFGIAQYLWSPGGQTTASISAKPSNTNTYYVAVKNNFNCSASASRTIYVKQKPVARFSFSSIGNTYFFADSSKNALKWHWTFGDGNESFKQNPVYTFSGDTFYGVTLVISDPPCANDTFSLSMKGNPAHVVQINFSQLKLLPNPTLGMVDVQSQSNEILESVEVFDAVGKRMGAIKHEKLVNGSLNVDLSPLPPGAYTLLVQSKTTNYRGKIMKQ